MNGRKTNLIVANIDQDILYCWQTE